MDTQATYDRIASHFSKTREYPWPEVEAFLDGREADRALDVGCGNGRHTELIAERALTTVGLDLSRELLAAAAVRSVERGYAAEFVHGDAGRLPFAEGVFGLATYVATLHHLSSRQARVASLAELKRVLSVDGVALVSAWSTVHDRFADRFDEPADQVTEGFDTTVDWTLPGGETVPRFYHIYAPAEFEADIVRSGLSIASFEISSGNCYAVVTPSQDS